MIGTLRQMRPQSGRCCLLLCATPPGAQCACLQAPCMHILLYSEFSKMIFRRHLSCTARMHVPSCRRPRQKCEHLAPWPAPSRILLMAFASCHVARCMHRTTFWRRCVQGVQRVEVGGLGDALPRQRHPRRRHLVALLRKPVKHLRSKTKVATTVTMSLMMARTNCCLIPKLLEG